MADENAQAAYDLRTPIPPALAPALVLGRDLPAEIGGQPCKYFWRELIRQGDFVHPADDRQIKVGDGELKTWQDNFARMQANGVKVTVPVDHRKGTANNRGYVQDVRVRDGRLEGLLQLIGDDAIRDCARSEISVRIVPELKDGLGNVYKNAIEHASLVIDPVIPGQGDAIAASRASGADDTTPTFTLSTSTGSTEPERHPMPNFADLRKRLGQADDVSEDALLAKACERITAADAAAAKVADLSRDLAAATAKVTDLSRTPDPADLAREAKYAEREIDLQVREGHLPAAIATKLKAKLRDGDKPNAYMLSRTGPDANAPVPVNVILDLFGGSKMGDGVTTGTATGVQTLSRTTPGAEAEEEQAKKEEAWRKQGEAMRAAQLAARGLKD